MNKILSFIAIAIIVVLNIACKQNKKVTKSDVEVKQYSITDIYAKGDELSGNTILVKGVVDKVCKHTGKRFKVVDEKGMLEIKVELGEEFPVLDNSIIGKKVKAMGVLIPVQMGVKEVMEWEKKMKVSHKGQEDTKHYKEELDFIKGIYYQIKSGEIPFYTTYRLMAEKYYIE